MYRDYRCVCVCVYLLPSRLLLEEMLDSEAHLRRGSCCLLGLDAFCFSRTKPFDRPDRFRKNKRDIRSTCLTNSAQRRVDSAWGETAVWIQDISYYPPPFSSHLISLTLNLTQDSIANKDYPNSAAQVVYWYSYDLVVSVLLHCSGQYQGAWKTSPLRVHYPG